MCKQHNFLQPSAPPTSYMSWLVGDHLGSGVSSSPSVGSMDAVTGVKTYECYKPWGENRGSTTLPTRYQFTGQRREASLNGLYDYGARYYDSLAGVFLQPDSLVPDPYNPLDWNRFLFVRGNAINYNDPDGHCPLLVTALIGAGIAAAVDYSWQVYDNYQKGEGSQSWVNVDGAEIVGAAVAGGIAGGTLGLGTAALTTVVGAAAATELVAIPVAAVAGGVGNAVGGQVGALAEAGWRQGGNAEFDQGQFYSDAFAAGFLNSEDFIWDAGTGAILGAAGQAVNNLTTPAFSNAGKYKFFNERTDLEGNTIKTFKTTPARLPGDEERRVFSGSVAGFMRGSSNWLQEIIGQGTDRYKE